MILYKYLLATLSCLIFVTSYSQNDTLLQDTFEAELAPNWTGNRDHFITNPELKLNATLAGESMLAFPINILDEILYSFDLTLSFSPSKSNLFRYYLYSDSSDFNNSKNALYLEIGEDGSADGISIYERKNNVSKLIKKTFDSQFSNDVNKATISILVKNSNLKITTLNTSDSMSLVIPNIKGFTGILCHYTVTRKDKYSFDNLLITSKKSIDEIGPKVIGLKSENSNIYYLTINESLSKYNFVQENKILWSEINSDSLIFQLKGTLAENLEIELVDLSENKSIYLLEANANISKINVCITELMFDPDPVLFLPNYEYIELYNFSDENIELENWKISDLSSTNTLPSISIKAKESLIITSGKKEYFNSITSDVISISNLVSLNNEGDVIKLYNNKNDLISYLEYNPTYIQNKSEGGKSIESTHLNPCQISTYDWQYSKNYTGGTPGVFEFEIKENQPIKPSINQITDSSITLKIGELWNRNSFNSDFVKLNNKNIRSYSFQELDLIELKFSSKTEKNTLYTLEILNLKNCKNTPTSINLEFVKSDPPQENEIIFNEIVQKSNSGVQFIELKNTSEKSFASTDINLGLFKNNEIQRIYTPTTYRIIKNNDFLVLTTDTLLLNEYSIKDKSKVIALDFKLTKEFEIGILNQKGEILDYLNSNTLDEAQNINPYPYASWERITTFTKTNDSKNWLKSGQNVNFGTPTKENSVININNQLDEIIFSTKIIKPNSSNQEENTLEIQTNLESENWVLTLYVRDRNGNLIDIPYNNIPISAKGNLSWKGFTKSGKQLEEELYILILHLLNQKGETRIVTKPIIIDQ